MAVQISLEDRCAFLETDFRILLFDESPLDVASTVVAIREAGISMTPTIVNQAGAFQSALLRKEYDFVLAAYHFSDFSGLEALEMTQALQPDCSFLFVADAWEELPLEKVPAGVKGYISKSELSKLPETMLHIFATHSPYHQAKRENKIHRVIKRMRTQIERNQRILHETRSFLMRQEQEFMRKNLHDFFVE